MKKGRNPYLPYLGDSYEKMTQEEKLEYIRKRAAQNKKLGRDAASPSRLLYHNASSQEESEEATKIDETLLSDNVDKKDEIQNETGDQLLDGADSSLHTNFSDAADAYNETSETSDIPMNVSPSNMSSLTLFGEGNGDQPFDPLSFRSPSKSKENKRVIRPTGKKNSVPVALSFSTGSTYEKAEEVPAKKEKKHNYVLAASLLAIFVAATGIFGYSAWKNSETDAGLNSLFSKQETNVQKTDKAASDSAYTLIRNDISPKENEKLSGAIHGDVNETGLASAFSDVDLQEENESSQLAAIDGAVLVMLDGQVVGVLEDVEAYQKLKSALMDPYTKPVAGGTAWRRGFVSDVDIFAAEDEQDVLSVEDAIEKMEPTVQVRLREKCYDEIAIPYETIVVSDETMAEGEKRVAVEGKDGVREESYEVISVNGTQTERNLLGTRVITPAVQQVELVGADAEAIDGSASPADSLVLTPSPTPSEQISESLAPLATPKTTPQIKSAVAIPEESFDPVATTSTAAPKSFLIPEESIDPKPSETVAPSPKPVEAKKRSAGQPSSSFSSFNFPTPTETWYGRSDMGIGKNYPGIDLEGDTNTDRNQGIAGPAAPVSFSAPSSARVSSYFGWRKSTDSIHYGIDYAAEQGTEIHASAAGTVTWYTREDSGTFGKVVEINHGGGFTTLYAHCDSLLVEEGDYVEKGQAIATAGSSASSATHLHFEIRCDGVPYNPFFYF